MSWAWNGKRDKKVSESYRRVYRTINSALIPKSKLKDVRAAFSRGLLGIFDQPRDYRGYLGEYPARTSYTRRIGSAITFKTKEGGIDFENIALVQLRGNEWEREYSNEGRSKSLTVPAPKLIEFGNLSWDGKGGWIDDTGNVQILDPNWSGEEPTGLIAKARFIDAFLTAQKYLLISVKSEMKYVAGMTGGDGRFERLGLFVRRNGSTKLLDTRLDLEDARSNEDEAIDEDAGLDAAAVEEILAKFGGSESHFPDDDGK